MKENTARQLNLPENEDSLLAEAQQQANDVAAYLKAHPDFFLANPTLIEDLELPGPPTEVSSLHHWQLRRWRSRAHKMAHKLAQLHWIAEQNAESDALLHQLACKLVALPDNDPDAFKQALHALFAVDTIAIWPRQALPAKARKALRGWFDNPAIRCGHIGAELTGILFDQQLPETGSTALIALSIREHSITHVLALGRSNPDGFNPAQGTLFLEQIGELAEAYLARAPEVHSVPEPPAP